MSPGFAAQLKSPCKIKLSNYPYSSDNGNSEMTQVYIGVTEKHTTYLNKENHPCMDYSHEKFVNCSKIKIWKCANDKMKCIWRPQKTFIPATEKITTPNCTDKKSAKMAWKHLFKCINMFITNSSAYSCPTPCQQTHFKYEVQYFHRNVDIYFYESLFLGF